MAKTLALPKFAPLPADSRALKAVRDTKGELVPGLEIHTGRDFAGSLGYTKVDCEPG